MMQYPLYQQQGWPIGSGMVESANKLVVEARLKGAGMHWQRTHDNPMLALRNGVCNKRSDEALRDIVHERHSRRETQRQQKATVRVRSLLSSFVLLPFPFALLLQMLLLPLPVLLRQPPPCLVLAALLLIIPGNEFLRVVRSSLQKCDAHPFGVSVPVDSESQNPPGPMLGQATLYQ